MKRTVLTLVLIAVFSGTSAAYRQNFNEAQLDALLDELADRQAERAAQEDAAPEENGNIIGTVLQWVTDLSDGDIFTLLVLAFMIKDRFARRIQNRIVTREKK